MSNPNFFDTVGTQTRSGNGEAVYDGEDCAQPSPPLMNSEPKLPMLDSEIKRWATNGEIFWQASKTIEKLAPGFYEPDEYPNIGIALTKRHISTDNLMRLPDSASDAVIAEFAKFWSLKEKFESRGFLHKRGILLWGPPGCHAKGQGILMFDGNIKPVEDVVVGEFLMGPDGTAREVLKLCRGKDEMFRIVPNKGTPFVVNGDHVLALSPTTEATIRTPINMTVRNYLKQSKTFQNRTKLYRAAAISFEEKELLVPPYILGAWLGDGHSDRPALTTADKEMADTWTEYGSSLGLKTRKEKGRPNNKSSVYYLTAGLGGGAGKNPVVNALRSLNVLRNKHIPHIYLTASIHQRLDLLAGLLDTDGYVSKAHGSYTSVKKILANQVAYLARSLGFAAYVKKCRKGTKYQGRNIQIDAYNVNISGDLSIIPVQLERKQASERKQIKDVLKTGFSVEYVGYDNYYGFILDKDHLYLLDDFTVTHNSGKTASLMLMAHDIVNMHQGIVVELDHPKTAAAGLALVRKIEPTRPIVAFLEDLDALVERWGENNYLSLLDGETQVDNIVYIACPAPETLILTTDLRWVRADSLSEGDGLIAFDEYGPDRKLRTSYVRSCPLINRERFRVTTDMGTTVVSIDHPFLIQLGNRPYEWRKVQDLNPGNRICWIGNPWTTDTSWNAGYLAGQFDGEGTLNFTEANEHGGGRGCRAVWGQAEGIVANKMRAVLTESGFLYHNYDKHDIGVGKDGTPYKDQTAIIIADGKWETMRFLGSIRPTRMLANPRLPDLWEGTRPCSSDAKVISVEPIGVGPVVALDTTTNTFIGDGLLQHNTTNYPERLDKRFVDRPSRFDTVRFIGMPTAAARRTYLKAKEPTLTDSNLDLWVDNTEGFSIAHLRELVILVQCFERPLEEAIERLESMRIKPSSEDSPDKVPFGFGQQKRANMVSESSRRKKTSLANYDDTDVSD